MMNCGGNENDNNKIDHINKTYIDQDVDAETNRVPNMPLYLP